MHPLFEYDLIGKNSDPHMTIFYPELRLRYVKIETINMTIRIHEKNLMFALTMHSIERLD